MCCPHDFIITISHLKKHLQINTNALPSTSNLRQNKSDSIEILKKIGDQFYYSVPRLWFWATTSLRDSSELQEMATTIGPGVDIIRVLKGYQVKWT